MRKKIVGILVLMMILFANSVLAADIASGTSGTCTWVIDENGSLVVSPSSGEEGTLGSGYIPWKTYCDSIQTASFEGTIHVNNTNYMFDGCTAMTNVDLTGLDTSNADYMYRMFSNCSSLTSIDVSGLDTSRVYSTVEMFRGCSSLTSLDLSSWNTSNLSSMDYMFEDCTSLETIDISSFNTAGCYPGWYVNYSGGLFHTFKNLPSLQTLIVGDEFVWDDYSVYDITDIMDEYPEDFWHKVDTDEYYTEEQFLGNASAKGGTYVRSGRTVEFIKVDDDTNEPIEGASFYLKNQWDEYVVSTSPLTFGEETDELLFTTDAEGKLMISGLNLGRYFLYEKEPAEGYENNSDTYLIEITSDEIFVLQLASEDDYELDEIASQDDTSIWTPELTDDDKTNQYQTNYTNSDTWISNTTATAYWEDMDEGLAVVYFDIIRGSYNDNCDKLTMKVSPRFSITEVNHSDELSYTIEGENLVFNTENLSYRTQYYIELVLQLKKETHDGEWFSVFSENALFGSTDENSDFAQVIPSPKLCELRAIYSGDELEINDNGAFIITNTKLPTSSYTVKYLDKETNESISGDKVEEEVVVGTEITVADEVIEIEGYVFDSSEVVIVTISENEEENVIKLYYVTEDIATTPTNTPTPTPTKKRSGGSSKPKVEEKIEETPSGEVVPSEAPSGESLSGEILPENIPSGEIISGDVPSGEEVPPPTPTSTKKYHYSLKKEDDGHHDWYVRGYEDYTFRINNSITREEIATIFYRLTVVPEGDIRQSLEVTEDPFKDVDKDRWSARPIAYMKTLGVMQGYPDGNFDPTKPITRAEFAEVARKYAESTIEHKGETFQDVEDGYWASEAIRIAYEQGWIQGYDDGTFRPTQNISRVETVTIVNRMLHRKLNTFYLDKVKIPVVDLDPNHWGYADVIEAIIEYDYELNEEGEENLLRYRYPFHEDMSDEAYNDV